jgi:hypothetical protein
MPPVTAHFNGGVNMPDAETVMREIMKRVPIGVERLPDGETGDRSQWIEYQFQKFAQTPQLDRVGSKGPEGTGYSDVPRIRLREGTDPHAIEWPNLGYSDEYRVTYELFRQLRDEGVIPDGVRFQVQFPTPLASVNGWIEVEDQLVVEPSYEKALIAEVERFVDSVPHSDTAVQWDVAIEFGILERVFAGWEQYSFDSVVQRLVRCVDCVAADVQVGMHLCYGDRRHRHFVEPESIELQVRVLNAVAEAVARPVSFASFTVPQYRVDEAFFAPLRELVVPGAERLSFGIVPYHAAEQEGGVTAKQVEHIDRFLKESAVEPHLHEWGVSTECGMRRAERAEVPGLMDLHREILAIYR